MTNQITVLQLDSQEVRETLAEILRPVFKEELSSALEKVYSQQPDTVLSRREAAKLLNVCPVTLSKLFYKGEVHGQIIGSRIKFMRSEIENAVKTRSAGKLSENKMRERS